MAYLFAHFTLEGSRELIHGDGTGHLARVVESSERGAALTKPTCARVRAPCGTPVHGRASRSG